METELGIQTILQNQALSCSPLSGSSCPEGVGRVLIQSETNPQEFILCTGFLITPDQVVTNGHCLSRTKDCARTYVIFAGSNAPVTARCDSLIKTYYDETDFSSSQDISVFSLNQKLNLRPFQVASEDAEAGEKYSVWVMDHFNILEARLTEFECRFEGEGLTEEYSSCPMVQGNSGSPILDGQGEAVSIIWGSSLDRSVGPDFDLMERRELGVFSFAYSLEVLRSSLQ